MIRAVLDTNLLVSYLLTHRPPIAILIDHYLARVEAFDDLFAECFLGNRFTEVLYYFIVNVGFEEGGADFSEGVSDVGFGYPAAATEVAEDVVKLFC